MGTTPGQTPAAPTTGGQPDATGTNPPAPAAGTTQTGSGQVPTTTGQEGGGAPGGQAPSGEGGSPPQSYDAAYVTGLRKESADMRKALRETQAKLKEIEDANLSETEKLRRETEALRQEVTVARQASRERDVLVAATKAGARRPEVVAKLVPTDAEDITAAMETLRKEYPEFFQAGHGSADGAAGNANAGGNAGGGTGTPNAPAKMSDQIRAAVRHRLMGG